MNVRDQFLATMSFDTDVPTMKWEMGYWAETLRRWCSEGLPRHTGIPDALADGDGVPGMGTGWQWGQPRADDVNRACKLDHPMERLPLNIFVSPTFIPCFDHYVHPDVSWSDFSYYRKQLNGLINNELINN